MKASARDGNRVAVVCGPRPVTVWLAPELIDYQSPVDVRVNARRVRVGEGGFLKPELDPLLDDLRDRADRRRTYTTRLEL